MTRLHSRKNPRPSWRIRSGTGPPPAAPDTTMERTKTVERAEPGRNRVDYEQFICYEEGQSTVVCDRKNPNAWIKSDVLADVEA